MSETAPLIRLKDFCLRRPGAARAEIEDFSLSLDSGGTLTLLGEAGSGKEAVLRLFAGVLEKRDVVSGTLQIRGGEEEPVTRRMPLELRTAFLPVSRAQLLNPHMSVLAQLSLVVSRKLRQPLSSARAEIALALSRLPNAPRPETLDHPRAMVPQHALAMGLLAASMAQTPELLIAEDLLGELSPSHARALAAVLQAEQKRLGFALLYTAASAEAANLLGEKLIVLRSGHMVEEGPVSRLSTAQSHAYTQTLFRATAASPNPQTQNPRATSRGETVLQVQNVLLAGRGKQGARDNLNFELRRGASLALLGEQGSGRHALTCALLGLDPVLSGRVVFDQVDIGILSEGMMSRLRRRIAFITGEDEALDPRMTIFDTVEEPLRAHVSMPRDTVARNRDAALKRVGLAALPGHRSVAALSPFDRRRLQIARAVVGAPLLAVIDEPLRGLDAFAQSVVRDLLRSFRSTEGPAFLVITSDFALAQAFSEEVFVFHDGRIVERGPIATLLRAPQDSQTRKLIDAVAAGAPAALPPLPPQV